MKSKWITLIVGIGIALSVSALTVVGQEQTLTNGLSSQTFPLEGNSPEQAMQESLAGQTIPLWRYWVKSPADNRLYIGYIMGRAPGTRGPNEEGITYIPTYIVPLIVNMPDGGVFDPTVPDNNCAAGNVPLALVEDSPLFQDSPMVWGGTNLGNTQYVDAVQRGQFWKVLQATAEPWHTKFQETTLNPVTVTVPRGFGKTYKAPCGKVGRVNLLWLDTYLKGVLLPQLRKQGIGSTSFPLFLLYNVYEYASGDVGGYHSAYGAPMQVFAVSVFDTSGLYKGATDVSILTHELGEAMNDPTGRNFTPAWGPAGQQRGCQNNFEDGDPLTFRNNPAITLNNFTYHPQELAFYAWFFRSTNIGVNGWYSSNGAFLNNAGRVCH